MALNYAKIASQPQLITKNFWGTAPRPSLKRGTAPPQIPCALIHPRLFTINQFICWNYMARHVDIQCIFTTGHPGHVPNRPLKTLPSVLSSYWLCYILVNLV